MIRSLLARRSGIRGAALLAGTLLLPLSAAATEAIPIATSSFQLVKRESGPVNYYMTLSQGGQSFIRATYRPPMKTAVLGVEFPDSVRHDAHLFRWRWRALKFPEGGNECASGMGDSAAVVYLTWRSGLKWYTLKYVWSSVGPKGAVCDKKRGWFVVQDTVILESGPPAGQWITEQIDPTAEFRKHFRNGDPKAEVPPLMGIGIMSDGDQTHSESSADYGGFEIGN